MALEYYDPNQSGPYTITADGDQAVQQRQQQAPAYDIDAWYQQMLGRAPDANERSTDLANIQKYGAEGFQQDFQKRLNNTPNQQAPNYATPTQQWNQQPAMQPQSDQLFQMLMQRAQQPTAVNRNDPNIRSQVDPVVAQQERASRNYIDDIAEKSGPLANIQGEKRLAAERSGQAAGAFESEVIGREIAARRDEIMQSLQLYGSLMTQQQQMALQRELAQLNATLQRDLQGNSLAFQRDQMGTANDQFLKELALREWDLANSWDYRWSGLGG